MADMGKLDTEYAGAWMNLLQANSVLSDELESKLQDQAGLSLAEHELLARLSTAPDGSLRMCDLASQLLVSRSGITRLVDRLHRMGLVRRDASPVDRRVINAVLTDKGRKAYEDSLPVFAASLEKHFSRHLSQSDVKTLRRILRKVLSANDAWDDARCSSPILQNRTSAKAS